MLADRARRFDSGPATLALTHVALTVPEREFEAVKAIQKARYVEGCDITEIAVLAGVLRGLSLHKPADRLAASDPEASAAYHKRIEAASQQMRLFGTESVPDLIAGPRPPPPRPRERTFRPFRGSGRVARSGMTPHGSGLEASKVKQFTLDVERLDSGILQVNYTRGPSDLISA